MAEAIKVAVRVRPFSSREQLRGGALVVGMSGQTTSLVGKTGSKSFDFDYSYWSFDEADSSFASQDLVFQDIGTVILSNSFHGYNGCLFAYGQTGSGKSYTMMGYEDKGIIPRMVASLYQDKACVDSELRIGCSFVELYNEHLRDLLSPSHDHVNLKVTELPDHGIMVPGMLESPCLGEEDVTRLMDFGLKKRVTAATNMNATSSRSHSIFILRVQRLTGSSKDEKGYVAKINLVDLAGSERNKKTRAEGERLKEGCYINQSLTALGLVIETLSAKAAQPSSKDVVPFRSSKLTFLLKDSLAGNSKTFLLAALSPAEESAEETLSTLRFAASVKKIKTVAKQNLEKKEELISSLRSEMAKLKAQLAGAADAPMNKRMSVMLQGELDGRRLLLDLASRTYQEALVVREEQEALQTEFLSAHGLTSHQIEHHFMHDDSSKDTPYLLNLSDDSLHAGCLMYFLKPGMELTIGSSKESSILMHGLGIGEQLCTVEAALDRQSVQITLPPHADDTDREKGRVYVNGRLMKPGGMEQTKLKHMDKILFGRAYAMRLIVPAEQRRINEEEGCESTYSRRKSYSETKYLTEDLSGDDVLHMLLPHPEDSEALGELKLYFEDLNTRLEDRAPQFFEQLAEASHLVDEANEITLEVRPTDRFKFEVEFVWDIHRDTQDIIVIRVLQYPLDEAAEAAVLYYWTLERFCERVEHMRDVYHDFASNRRNDSTLCGQEAWPGLGDVLKDPWMDPSQQELKVRLHHEEHQQLTTRARAAELLKTPAAGTAKALEGTADTKNAINKLRNPGRSRTNSPIRDRAARAFAKERGGRESPAPRVRAGSSVEVLAQDNLPTEAILASTLTSQRSSLTLPDSLPSLPENPFVASASSQLSRPSARCEAPAVIKPKPLPAGYLAEVAGKDAIIDTLQEELRAKDSKERRYRQDILALQSQLAELERAYGPMLSVASDSEKAVSRALKTVAGLVSGSSGGKLRPSASSSPVRSPCASPPPPSAMMPRCYTSPVISAGFGTARSHVALITSARAPSPHTSARAPCLAPSTTRTAWSR